MCPSIYVYICVGGYKSIYIYLSIYLSIYRSIHLSILSMYMSLIHNYLYVNINHDLRSKPFLRFLMELYKIIIILIWFLRRQLKESSSQIRTKASSYYFLYLGPTLTSFAILLDPVTNL